MATGDRSGIYSVGAAPVAARSFCRKDLRGSPFPAHCSVPSAGLEVQIDRTLCGQGSRSISESRFNGLPSSLCITPVVTGSVWHYLHFEQLL